MLAPEMAAFPGLERCPNHPPDGGPGEDSAHCFRDSHKEGSPHPSLGPRLTLPSDTHP